MQALPNLQSGMNLAIVHDYAVWSAPAPIAELDSVSANGSIPMLDWTCGIPDSTVAQGGADATITAYAQALKAYAKPVFLRWYWEMNIPGTRNVCQSAGGAADYVAAWRHIWTIFHDVGATNVSFVWCPGIVGSDPAPYYPGNAYVDWIGIDGYDRHNQGTAAFSGLFSAYYQTWSVESKPMMVAETGAMASDQAAYLAGVQTALPSYPEFKAFVYWDAVGKSGKNWVLAGSGLTAFQSMERSTYFSANSLVTQKE
jgi:hypothetical protein